MDVTEQKLTNIRSGHAWWPTPQDYNEAVQNPATSFSDPELQVSECAVDNLGLPRPVSGAFASVYQMNRPDGTRYAVRCFLRNVKDQAKRYETLSAFIMNDSLDSTVKFDYQERGILIRGEWFPVLKMEWVEGQTLDNYIRSNLQNRHKLFELKDRFYKLVTELNEAGVAHGDLQHGNIMVTPAGELRLVDYDGMFVPSMTGLQANELGHRNYQHPKRSAEHFNHHLDTFAAWSILTSLTAIAESPVVFNRLSGGDDCLLFRRADYEDIWNARAMVEIERINSAELNRCLNALAWLCTSGPHSKLGIEEVPPEVARPSRRLAISASKVIADSESKKLQHRGDEFVEHWWTNHLQQQSKSPQTEVDVPLVEPELLQNLPRRVIKVRHGDVGPTEILMIGFSCSFFASIALLGSIHWLVTSSIGVLLTLVLTRKFESEQRLVQNGLAVPGLITKKEKTEWDNDGVKVVRHVVHYEYPVRSVDGTMGMRKGSTECAAKEFAFYAEGGYVTILYDKNSPSNNVIYELCSFKAIDVSGP